MKQLSLFILTVLLCGCTHPEDPAPAPEVSVKVARAGIADVELTVQAPATIFPREQANISARITAPILQLKARKGDRIATGQVLAVLQSKDVEAQNAEASANLADAEATLQKMSAGTLPTDIERAQGQVQIAAAALNQAQKNFDRRKELFSQGAIPNRDLLLSETELSQAKTAHDVAKRALDLLRQQSSKTDVRIAESRVEQAKARRALAEAQLHFTELKSPLTGTITEQFMYAGDMAKPDAPVFTVMDLSTAIARAQVAQADASRVSQGQTCFFSQPDRQSNSAKGRISVINQAVDPARRTVEVWCELPNGKGTLKAGLFGAVTIVVGEAKQAIVLPESAVQFQEGTGKGTALVIDKQHIGHVREVEATPIPEGQVRVIRGIKVGDMVVVEGGYCLPDGTRVKLAEAAN
jgi:multidrug efflux pump subunit AcrA (membrane-fusion protein)